MAYKDLREFISALGKAGELKRISAQVSAELEITEITDRISKNHGPALLFENVEGAKFPVLINAFGSFRRMNMALEVDRLDDIAARIKDFLKLPAKTGLFDKLKGLPKLMELASFLPKTVRTGPCKEVILKDDEASLDIFPILKCWPGDGGKFITLPLIFTKDPETGIQNAGMYRLQVYDARTTGMHWHMHKDGAENFRKKSASNRRMEAAVAIGTDPATTYAATAPLPHGIDEMIFAGFLRREPVEMVKCETVDIEMPACSEIVLEGYIDPGELRLEGPFGDHTGYYSLADYYPVFHITCITHRKDAIYPATVVGRPPMEDCYLGKATERIFLPLLQMQLPEIVDMNLPMEGVFHNCAIISIKKAFPGHARKVMSAVWGMGQMMFTKFVIIVDADVDVHNTSEVVWKVFNNVDPKRDVMITEGPIEVLDHASPLPRYGSKMGIDGTKKWKSEGFEREWPDEIKMDERIRKLVDERWNEYFK